MNYKFVRVKKTDLNEVLWAFNAIRDRALNQEFFYKKFNSKWTGVENLAMLIRDEDNRLLGHLGIQPLNIKLNEKNYLAGQISDAFIDKKLRGKNVFKELIERLTKLAFEENIDFLFVLPSPQAVKGFEDNEWKKVDAINYADLNIKTIPLNKVANKFGIQKLYHYYVSVILFLIARKSPTLDNPSFEQGYGGVSYSLSFVKHKNYTSNFPIKLNGFDIWFKIDDGMRIGLTSYFEASQKRKFIKTVRFLALLLGCHKVTVISSQKSFLNNLLPEFEYKMEMPVYYKPLNSNINFDKVMINGCDINTF